MSLSRVDRTFNAATARYIYQDVALTFDPVDAFYASNLLERLLRSHTGQHPIHHYVKTLKLSMQGFGASTLRRRRLGPKVLSGITRLIPLLPNLEDFK